MMNNVNATISKDDDNKRNYVLNDANNETISKHKFLLCNYLTLLTKQSQDDLETEDLDEVYSDKIGFLEASFAAHLLKFEEHTDN